MPELPEVEIVRRGMAPVMAGDEIRSVQINRHDLRVPVPRDFAAQVSGQKVLSLGRRGKYILIHLRNGRVIVLHLGMSGRVRIYGPGDRPERQKHDHIIFEMAGAATLVFNDSRRFGMVYLSGHNSWRGEKPFHRMGPEPLDAKTFTRKALLEAVQKRRGPVKTVLLDQSVVAGLGNIYVCEALFESRIDPRRPANSLSAAEADALTAAIRSVLKKALAAGGSTLRDYAQTDGTLGYFQNRFSVYDRVGRPCPACVCEAGKTDGVKRIKQAGRSTFYCPARQC